MFWSAGCSLLRAEGFSCSLDVLYGGLGISKLQSLIKNIKYLFLLYIFPVFGHQNPWSGLDPDRYSAWSAGSGSGLNESGSETLPSASRFIPNLPPVFNSVFRIRIGFITDQDRSFYPNRSVIYKTNQCAGSRFWQGFAVTLSWSFHI